MPILKPSMQDLSSSPSDKSHCTLWYTRVYKSVTMATYQDFLTSSGLVRIGFPERGVGGKVVIECVSVWVTYGFSVYGIYGIKSTVPYSKSGGFRA